MSWTYLYRLALRLLPAGLRRKHGGAMEALFRRELGQARTRGRLQGALAGVAGVWDVIRRGAYEHVREGRDSAGDRHDFDGPLMPQPTTRQLLRRHAASFTIVFVALTVAVLALFATRQLPALRTPETPSSAIAEALLLALPFTAALTIPMAVLVAVLWEFTRLGANGTLAVARRERTGIRRLVVPVLGAAVGVAVLAFVVTAEIVPRANERLVAVLAGEPVEPSDRMMTIGELREAARRVRPDAEPLARARVARYEVEFQKKLALPAACVILALFAVAIARDVSRNRTLLVIGASVAVFGGYYWLMITGESLANRLVISPFVGMWGANALLLAATLVAAWRHRARLA
jgi:lipopolysaccharide export LptBFGC system permease protein LptF